MSVEMIIIIGILLLVLVFVALVVLYASRYKKVPPDKAMVVYGKRGFKVITGGAKFIVPIIESYEFLPLDVRTLDVNVQEIVTDVTRSGARVNIKSVAQIKVSSDKRVLNTAAEHLLHKSDHEINEIALKTLEGHVRGVCATLTVEEINSDRDTVATRIQNMAGNDLMNMGIEIRSFVIRDLEDEYGYLEALGIKRTEEVKRDARIGKAHANREATIQEARAAQEGEQANADAEAQVALYHRDRDITRQKAQAEVEIERANREIAFGLQDAKRKQELVVEQRTIDIRDKEKRIELQQKEVLRKEQEQAAEQVVPAKARADAMIAEADGMRQKLALVAAGNAEKIRQEGKAQADVIRMVGEAEAAAIKAKGLAEAEAMEKKARAWELYGKAAVTEIIVDKLPEIVAEASRPLENTEKLIIMGNDGPQRLVGSVVDIAAQAPALVKSLTGMDVSELTTKLRDLVKGTASA